MNKILFACFVLILAACKTDTKRAIKPEPILGEWFYAEENPYAVTHPFNYGFTFFPNNIADFKYGYYRYAQIGGGAYDDRVRQIIGTKTRYKIDKDSLKIFSLADSIWSSIVILSVTEDTLILRRGCAPSLFDDKVEDCMDYKYAKHHQNLDTVLKFDKISLSSSGCYGICPIIKINLYDNGKVEFYGREYTMKKGFFTSQISIEKYTELANNFRKTHLSTLKDKYEADHTDDESISVRFWQGSKLVKKIEDYGHASPSPFVCAYTQLRFLYQQINLTPLNSKVGEKIFKDN